VPNVLHVVGDCLGGEAEPSGDQDILEPVRDEQHNLALADRQSPYGGVGRDCGVRLTGFTVGLSDGRPSGHQVAMIAARMGNAAGVLFMLCLPIIEV
jgi:hypothetical protein